MHTCPVLHAVRNATSPAVPPAIVDAARCSDDYFAQPLSRYEPEDHHVWQRLYARQRSLLESHVCREFQDGLKTLALPEDRVPNFDTINRTLMQSTQWQLVAVSGLLSDAAFFTLLAQRRFPVTWWLRSATQLDYLEEPDLFHDLFGHVPMLCQPVFANFMQRYGELGVATLHSGHLRFLARLYWYTVEFGLIRDPVEPAMAWPDSMPSAAHSPSDDSVIKQSNHYAPLRIYGAGIVSSHTECAYSLHSPVPVREAFVCDSVLQSSYKTSALQKRYFVIDDFEQLFDAVSEESSSFIRRCQKFEQLAKDQG